jgi:hypothetical protein
MLIGEEIYAAGAYVSGEAEQLGTIAGTDIAKLILIGLLLVGIVLTSAGSEVIQSILGAEKI